MVRCVDIIIHANLANACNPTSYLLPKRKIQSLFKGSPSNICECWVNICGLMRRVKYRVPTKIVHVTIELSTLSFPASPRPHLIPAGLLRPHKYLPRYKNFALAPTGLTACSVYWTVRTLSIYVIGSYPINGLRTQCSSLPIGKINQLYWGTIRTIYTREQWNNFAVSP